MAWLEQVAERTRKAKIFQDDADPTRGRFVAGIADQHYHDGSAWQDVDEALVDDGLDGFAHRCDKTRHIIRMGATGTRRWYPRRDHPTEYIEFGRLQSWSGTAWANVNLGTPTRSGNTITWDTVNFRLTLTNTWRRVKLEVVLKTEAARRRLRWQVSLTGLTWDSWQLHGADDTIVGTLGKPTAWDATGSADEPNVTITASYSGGYVEFGGDLSGNSLPITIDPTFTDGYGGDVATSKDTYIFQSAPTTNYSTQAVLKLIKEGGSGEAIRTLLQFDVSAIAAGSTCNSATLTLYVTIDENGSDTAINIYELRSGRAWVEAETTWNIYSTGNNWGTAGCSNTSTDRVDTAIGVWTGTATGVGAHNIALTTSAVATWFGASNSNYGMLAKGASEVDWERLVLASSDSATTAQRPILVVDYTEAAAGGTVLPRFMYNYRQRRM